VIPCLAWLTAIPVWLMVGPASAQVTLDQWGTSALTVTSDCADLCDPNTDLSWALGLTFGPTNGGTSVDLADANTSGPRGEAFAEASVLVPLAPVVRVNADSAPGGWVDGTGTAIQGFTYTGVAPDTIDVNVALTGTIGNPDGDGSTGLAAQVSYVGDANVASFVYANAILGLLVPDGAVQLEQTADGAVNLADVLSIPVSPGDQFYLVATSAATAGGTDAFAESLGTLAITFDPADQANLAAANAPLAVPTLAWPFALLLALALAPGLLRAAARRRSEP
jgi:hypothetical protein